VGIPSVEVSIAKDIWS
jgi:plasmid maintenance system killer protein